MKLGSFLMSWAALCSLQMASGQDDAEIEKIRKDFEWLTTRGTEVLDPEDNERFCREVGKKAAIHFPEECLNYIDRIFRLMSPGEEVDDSIEAALTLSIVSTLLEKNTERMVAWTKADESRFKVMFLVEGELVRSYATHAPTLVVDYFEMQEDKARGGEPFYARHALPAALGSLASKDATVAVSKLAVFRERRDYDSLVDRVAQNLEGVGRDAALKWLEENDPKGARDLEIAALGPSDPAKALDRLIADSPEGALDKRFSGVMSQWVHSDIKGSLAWAEGLPEGHAKDIALGSIARNWPQIDRDAAESWIQSLPESTTKTTGILAMIQLLGRERPEAALAWVERLPAASQARGYEDLFGRWIRNDPDRVMALLESSPLDEDAKERLRRQARFSPRGSKMQEIMALMGPNPEAALREIQKLPPGREREMMERMARGRVERDEDQFERRRDSGAYAAIVTKARTDPEAALEMLEGYPEGRNKDSLRQMIDRELYQKNPEKLLAKLRSMPEGEERDGEIRRYSTGFLRSEPQVALALAELFSERRREREVTRVFQVWLRRDPAKAAEALKKSDLPDEVKRSLLPPASRNR